MGALFSGPKVQSNAPKAKTAEELDAEYQAKKANEKAALSQGIAISKRRTGYSDLKSKPGPDAGVGLFI